MNEIDKTYSVYVCMDCKVEVHRKYYEVPTLRDVHRTICFVVDADTDTIIHHFKAKNYKAPEIGDEAKIWMHKKYVTDVIPNLIHSGVV